MSDKPAHCAALPPREMCDRCHLLDRHNRLLLALCYSADTRSSGRNASGSSCGSSSLHTLVFVALRVKGAQPQSLCDTKHQERVSVVAQQNKAYTQPHALTSSRGVMFGGCVGRRLLTLVLRRTV